MRIRALICDYDGTLNDSFQGGIDRIEALCHKKQIPFGMAELQRLVTAWGLPGVELIEYALNLSKDEAREFYIQWNATDEIAQLPLVHGAKKALQFNAERGIVTTILTSRDRENAEYVLRQHGILRDFKFIQTLQDSPFRKPDPRVFEYTLGRLEREYGISKEECVFIGDTFADIRAGQGAGVTTLVVRTGPFFGQAKENPVSQENIIYSIGYWPMWFVMNSSN